MRLESKAGMYPIFGKNQRLRPRTVSDIYMLLLQLPLRTYQIWSATQMQDWPEYACPLGFFFTLELKYWLACFQGRGSDLALRVYGRVPGPTSLSWRTPHCKAGVSKVPLHKSCPTTRAAAYPQPCCLPSSLMAPEIRLFSPHPPTLCAAVSHTAPHVPSWRVRVGKPWITPLTALERQLPGAVHWAAFLVSPGPVSGALNSAPKASVE